ncbi:MAG: dephospho-CoA kinase [Myxococcota bacterium]
MNRSVGLTGGISTGKSTVAGFFHDRAIPIVDADQVARDIVEPGQPAFKEIVAHFGKGVLQDGRIDRKALGAVVFEDKQKRLKLNAITHPRIGLESKRRMDEALKGDAPYVMYEAALLVENGLARAFGALVVVTVPEALQLERLMARDGSDEEAARQRIASQMPLSEKADHADYVIDNGGELEATRARVAEVHEALVERFTK